MDGWSKLTKQIIPNYKFMHVTLPSVSWNSRKLRHHLVPNGWARSQTAEDREGHIWIIWEFVSGIPNLDLILENGWNGGCRYQIRSQGVWHYSRNVITSEFIWGPRNLSFCYLLLIYADWLHVHCIYAPYGWRIWEYQRLQQVLKM